MRGYREMLLDSQVAVQVVCGVGARGCAEDTVGCVFESVRRTTCLFGARAQPAGRRQLSHLGLELGGLVVSGFFRCRGVLCGGLVVSGFSRGRLASLASGSSRPRRARSWRSSCNKSTLSR